ncbi:hypothetical protein CRG98_017840 [Punica granatum]|uniref:DUF7745 domain-containing protein n=1 Tax=Punica granatum TaxID=22663 RepID=A0A2I0K105_PUNGR|nr:hypothetical protein CRG98_017840 [Punica granatum]
MRFGRRRTRPSKKKRRIGSRFGGFGDRRFRKTSSENATFPLDSGRVDSHDAHPEHDVAQAVLAAVSRVLSRRRCDTQKREPPSTTAGILPSTHLHLLRSSPLSRARPIFLWFAQVQPVRTQFSPSETTRPGLSPEPFGLTQKSAWNRRIQTHGPVRPSRSLSRLGPDLCGPTFTPSDGPTAAQLGPIANSAQRPNPPGDFIFLMYRITPQLSELDHCLSILGVSIPLDPGDSPALDLRVVNRDGALGLLFTPRQGHATTRGNQSHLGSSTPSRPRLHQDLCWGYTNASHRVDWNFLGAAVTCWDPVHAVFNIQGTELTPTIEEYRTLVGRIAATRGIVEPNFHTTRLVLVSRLLGVHRSQLQAELAYSGGTEIVTAKLLHFIEIRVREVQGDLLQKKICHAILFLIFGTLLFPRSAGHIDAALASVVLQVVGGREYEVALLAETIRSLDCVTRKTDRRL